MHDRYDVIVIGAGAAGLFAAGHAAESGKRVLVLEKNSVVGKKLSITGGGRCNITNAEMNVRTLLGKYGSAEQFLYSPFSQFGVQDTFHFFESRGLALKVEANKRAFPITENARDVTALLLKWAQGAGVEIRKKSPVTKFLTEDGAISGVVCGNMQYTADAFVLATGGTSHPETGSTGDGLQWLKDLGHSIIPSTPTLVPLRVRDPWIHKLAGVGIDAMKIVFNVDGKRAFTETGRLLFTHFGLSGPLILNSAGKVQDLLEQGEVTGTIDIFPGRDFAEVEKLVLKAIDDNKNKDFRNVIRAIVPAGMGGAYAEIFGAGDIKSHSVTKDERKRFIHLLKAAPFVIDGLMGFDRAIVSDGGVPLTEIDTKTMRSLKVPNLFLVGDILHISRPSGGYSLQLCWTTGYVAGQNA